MPLNTIWLLNEMNKNTLLWDLGNVVVRWSPDTILRKLDYSSQQTSFVRESLFAHRDWQDMDRGVTTELEVAQRLVAESDLSIEQAVRCFDVVRDTLVDIHQSVELINEVAQTNTPMYVLSNMSNPNADYLRQRAYFSHFQGVVISAEEKLNKPDSALFERVLSRYSLEANSVLFIDDTLENIEAAGKLGIEGLHFKGSDECYSRIRRFVNI